jgi:hypothetical protein
VRAAFVRLARAAVRAFRAAVTASAAFASFACSAFVAAPRPFSASSVARAAISASFASSICLNSRSNVGLPAAKSCPRFRNRSLTAFISDSTRSNSARAAANPSCAALSVC